MTSRGMAIATAVAGLFTAATTLPAVAAAEEKGKVACQGINACKGQSDCKTAKSACNGQNGCKGQGIKYVSSEKECKDKGGTVVKK
ncbi:MAG: hypothetical protein HYV09_26785 [Deltaproteobacteria bacterium]|nr:hypothetical protein [Deltaproteobacteria bacterium]